VISYTLPPGLTLSKFKDGSGEWPWHDGRPIRSVSRILDRIWPMPPGLDPWYLERGKLVHHGTTLIDKGTIDWDTVDERIKPFLSAYQSFVDTAHPQVEAMELNVVHTSLKYGGRLDRVYVFPGHARMVVADIKTGIGKEDRYWCQCAALAMALDENNAGDYDLALVNLDKEGRPHYTEASDPGKWLNMWRGILEVDVA
jgi:hypothetical protein